MDTEDLVSVYTVTTTTEAEIVCNALKQVGIDARVGGETQAGLAGVLAIDVLTHKSDALEARKYLRQLRREKKERRHRHLEAKKAREAARAEPTSEAIQELDSPLPDSGFMKHDEEPDD